MATGKGNAVKAVLNTLDVRDLSVSPGGEFVLSIPKLAIKSGHILCLAGPNGSGKTTLIEALAGLQGIVSGSVNLSGKNWLDTNLRHTRAQLGYIPDDERWFIPELTAHEYLKLMAQVYADAKSCDKSTIINRSRELGQALYFKQFDQPLLTLSHGNKKKVQIIAGLMHQPDVILVDEIRNGLDPLAIIAVEEILRIEAKRGAIIIAASHDLWWSQRLATDIVLLMEGRLIVQATTKSLIAKHGSIESLFLETMKQSLGAKA